MASASTFPLQVHNCTNEEIVCRWFSQQVLASNEIRIPPRGHSVVQGAFVGMDIFASKAFDPSSTYASVHLEQPVNDIHFSEDAGGYGRGRMPEPSALDRDLGLRPPVPLGGGGGGGMVQAPVPRKPKRKKRRPLFGGVAKDGNAAETAGGDDDDNEPGAAFDGDGDGDELGQDANGGRVWVPGMGFMSAESIAQLPVHVRQAMMRQRQAQRQMPRGPISYAPPPPQLPYYQDDDDDADASEDGDYESSGGGLRGKLPTFAQLRANWKKYLGPAVLFLVMAYVAYVLLWRSRRK